MPDEVSVPADEGADTPAAEVPPEPATGGLTAALARAQARFATITKDKEAKVETRTGPGYSYRYADLASLIAAVREPLAQEGVAWTQDPKSWLDGGTLFASVTTTLYRHDESLSFGPLVLPVAGGTPQALGSALTYGRRYTLSAVLGVASEADDDGAVASAAGSTRDRSRRATQKQIAAVHALGAQKGQDHDAIRDWAGRNLGIESLTELTTAGAAAIVDALKALPDVDAPAGGGASPPAAPDAAPDDAAELKAAWAEAVEVIGSKAAVLDWYRDEFRVEGTVSTKNVTLDQLRQMVRTARDVKGAPAGGPAD